MNRLVKSRIERLASKGTPSCLSGGLKGVEKESLRVLADGNLSLAPHPLALGSAMTNRFITTDFSEALLEFVTPAFANTWEALRVLCEIHQFTYQELGLHCVQDLGEYWEEMTGLPIPLGAICARAT